VLHFGGSFKTVIETGENMLPTKKTAYEKIVDVVHNCNLVRAFNRGRRARNTEMAKLGIKSGKSYVRIVKKICRTAAAQKAAGTL
jgi:hypothetical protein